VDLNVKTTEASLCKWMLALWCMVNYDHYCGCSINYLFYLSCL